MPNISVDVELTMTNNSTSATISYGLVNYKLPVGISNRTDTVSGTYSSYESAVNAVLSEYSLTTSDFAGEVFSAFTIPEYTSIFTDLSYHNYGTSYNYDGNTFTLNNLRANIHYDGSGYSTTLVVKDNQSVTIGFPYIYYRTYKVGNEEAIYFGFSYMTVDAYNGGNGFNSTGNDVHFIVYRIEHNVTTSDYIIRNDGIYNPYNFAQYWNGYTPQSQLYPITYHYSNSTVSGPSEAAAGDTVTVSAVPDNNYGITDAASQILVTNDDASVSYNWNPSTNTITFTMPQSATNRGGFGSTGQ